MNITPEKYIERLMEASNKKYKLLQDMHQLTMEQSKVINDDGIESLEKLVAGKQKKIDAIDKIDEEFNVYFLRLKQVLGVKTLDELKEKPGIPRVSELQSAIKQIMELVQKIIELEQGNNIKAKELLNNLAGEVRKVNDGKKVNSAYYPAPAQTASYFVDKKK